ncbi:MAG: DUF262 domain-containing protein [Proteobacteria bacterium]|nr:DUF262 domain-containing protein [Pseudomonadota bacterium]
MGLTEEVDKMRKEIRTDGYPMSINEWISLYDNDEIDIHPEFQRYYRWSIEQKTRLIESILLGIPIPPIFVSQRADGVWDVVDGLQRLSTIYEFVGILKDETGKEFPPLVLQKTDYLPSLENIKWDDKYDEGHSLTSDQRLLIKRSKLSTSIILRESDDLTKFELFQRLNTGGSSLTPQEVRNCILVMLNKVFYEWLRELSEFDHFQEVISLSENPLQQQYDVELVLRFVVFSEINIKDLSNLGDVGTFLTNSMVAMAKETNFDFKTYEHSFKKSFELLNSSIGRDAFRKYNTSRNKHIGGFVLSPYEVIAYGLGYNINKGLVFDANRVKDKCISIWENPTFLEWSGSGINASRRLPRLVPLGRDIFSS